MQHGAEVNVKANVVSQRCAHIQNWLLVFVNDRQPGPISPFALIWAQTATVQGLGMELFPPRGRANDLITI